MSWWWGVLGHPLWAACTLVLVLVVRVQRKARWDPRACPVKLTGKTALVTGANTGIGKCIALDLARRGARVILACRDRTRGQAAVDQIRDQTGNSQVHLRILDLSSMESVRTFAYNFITEEKHLHLLVNNAAASGLPPKITEDGFDLTLATNHLGPFLLTTLLLDLLKRSAPSRIVTLASSNHHKGTVDFGHFHGNIDNHKLDTVYNHSKLHNILCTNELASRLQGTGVTVNSVHPGYVMTDVLRHYPLRIRLIFNIIGTLFFKSPEEGAVSPLYLCVSEEVEGITGKYFHSDCSLTLASPTARDSALQKKDYEFCEQLTAKL